MSLQLIVDSLDGVPEALRDQYSKEGNGKFRLDLEGYEDPQGLKSALQKEREAAKAFEKQAKTWAALGKSPEEIQELLKKQQEIEDKDLIDRKEFDKLLDKRTERMKSDYDKQMQEVKTAADAATARAKAYEGRVLDDAIRAAASKAGLHAQAIDDALFRGRALFSLDEGGNAVQLGEDGRPVLGKDGKTPFTPLEWLEGMKEKAPHWFPAAASGSGSHGNAGAGAPPNADWKKASTKDRVAILKAKNPELGKE